MKMTNLWIGKCNLRIYQSTVDTALQRQVETTQNVNLKHNLQICSFICRMVIFI